MTRILVAAAACLLLASCSPTPEAKPKTVVAKGLDEVPFAKPLKKHPLAKYLEISGFRLSEPKAGQLKIRFLVINHSQADLGELTLRVTLKARTAAAGDPPVGTIESRVPGLGPEGVQEVSATFPTKLRVYEIPDWLYLTADYEILSPAP
ncbi:MAG: hypothetical protein K2X35_19325 [Bryobacteraceae bacterium]|nr:hypothetical protein [Bryobacteraceae bacterium]